jgi:hypothetical protein
MDDMEVSAEGRKGRLERSIESRKAFWWMRSSREGGVAMVSIGRSMKRARWRSCMELRYVLQIARW